MHSFMATLSLAAGRTPRASYARGPRVPSRAAARAGATDTTAHSSGDVSSTTEPPRLEVRHVQFQSSTSQLNLSRLCY